MSTPSRYPLETSAAEIERLECQRAAMADDSAIMLDRIGVSQGWSALDLGCGTGGITDLLAARVGATGRVVGLDMNADFLAYARARAASNTSFVSGDIYSTVPAGAPFDIVHMRFVASTAGDPERLIAQAKRLARDRGTVALQEPDGSTLDCYPPNAAWDALKAALLGAFAGVGSDLELARKLYALARASGLRDVQYRTFLVAVRSGDPMTDYLPSTVESLRGTVLKLGLMRESDLDTALGACRAHLAKPDTSFTMYTVAQVWGRT
jgi:SAM-dependent methyltransferase